MDGQKKVFNRYSEQREAVLEELRSVKDHPTADMIYVRLRKKLPNISLGTVYRNLKQLGGEGKLITIETTDKCLHYDGDVSQHSHFLCNNCGKIIDLFVQQPVPKELTELGVTVSEQKLVYYGLCADCQKGLH